MMNMESRDDLYRAEEFLASIRLVQELDKSPQDESLVTNPRDDLESHKEPELDSNRQPDRNRIKELRKLLAGILLLELIQR